MDTFTSIVVLVVVVFAIWLNQKSTETAYEQRERRRRERNAMAAIDERNKLGPVAERENKRDS